MPTRGARTIYATIGDRFAWLCMAGLAASCRSARAKWSPGAVPAPEPQPMR